MLRVAYVRIVAEVHVNAMRENGTRVVWLLQMCAHVNESRSITHTVYVCMYVRMYVRGE